MRRLFLLGVLAIGACATQSTKESQAPTVTVAKATPPLAGGGARENDGPITLPPIPTTIPSVPGVPSIPGMGTSTVPGIPTVPGAGTVEGLDFKVPPCPPAIPALGLGISGTILMPKGDMALGGAKVTLVNALGAEQATTLSDGCGRFRFEAVVPGVYKVRFAVRTFKGESPVTVGAGGYNGEFRVDIAFLKIGVFKGSWDRVEKILDKVGVPYSLYENKDLATTDINKFNIVFINCNETSEAGVTAGVKEKLKTFVGGGGALYVSDRALPYVTATWPGHVTHTNQSGSSGTKKHTILDLQLGGYLRGILSAPIIYDLGAWRRIDKIQPATTLSLLRDSQTQEPAIVTFAYNNGFVGYTTYHQGAQMNDAMTFSLVFFITRL